MVEKIWTWMKLNSAAIVAFGTLLNVVIVGVTLVFLYRGTRAAESGVAQAKSSEVQQSEARLADFTRELGVVSERIDVEREKLSKLEMEFIEFNRQLEALTENAGNSPTVSLVPDLRKDLEEIASEVDELRASVNSYGGVDAGAVASVLLRDYAEQLTGPPGARGPQGPAGERGPQGPTGAPGEASKLTFSEGEIVQMVLTSPSFLEFFQVDQDAGTRIGSASRSDSRFPNAEKEGVYIEIRMLKRYTKTYGDNEVSAVVFLKNTSPDPMELALTKDGFSYVDVSGLVCSEITTNSPVNGISWFSSRSQYTPPSDFQYTRVGSGEEIIFSVSEFNCDNTANGNSGTVRVNLFRKEDRNPEKLSIQVFDVMFGEERYFEIQ